jgi:hypothetical protein
MLARPVVRKYLTTWLWYQDRLTCLSVAWLSALTAFSAAFLAGLAVGTRHFLDDVTFLFVDNDMTMLAVSGELVLLASAAVWLLSCCLGALTRRLVLHVRGR